MLKSKQVTRAFDLYGSLYIRGEGSIQEIRELRALLAHASEPQRVWIRRELDNEAQALAVGTAASLMAAIEEIAEPLRELAMRRSSVWVVFDAVRRGFALPDAPASGAPVSDALPATPPSEPAKPRGASQHKQGRSHDGTKPWSGRLGSPHHSK